MENMDANCHFKQTTKSGTHDSDSCLKEGTCLPLGGYRLVP